MRPLRFRILIFLSAVSVMLATPGITSSEATTPVVRDFKVRYTAEPTRFKGKRAMWIKRITISGNGVSRTRPQVRCDQKKCVKRRDKGKYRKVVKKGKITFHNVNWIIRRRQSFTVALHQRNRIGRYRRIGPSGKQLDRLVVKSAGCLRKAFKRRKCPPKTVVVAPGTPEPTAPVTPLAPPPEPCKTPPFAANPIFTELALTAEEANWNSIFVGVAGQNEIYRMAGGAPIYVSNWNEFGGGQPVTTVTPEVFDAFRDVPADGTFITGTTGDLTAYIITGGSPIPFTTWDIYGGFKTTITVDRFAIANAGKGGVWNHLRPYPADGAFVRGHIGATIYRIAGGAPIPFPSWSIYGGPKPWTKVDELAIAKADGGGVWNHLHQYPADGTLVNGGGDTEVYRVASGRPGHVCDAFDPKSVVLIAQQALENAGTGGVWNHFVGPFVRY